MKAHRLRDALLHLSVVMLGWPAWVVGATLTPYGCWSNLGFEESPPLNISQWSANGAAVSFVTDGAQAHTGSGAVKIDGTAPMSIWGGPASSDSPPKTGDTVGGYFWIKLLSAASSSDGVDVRMTGFISSVETVYCHTQTLDLSTLPLNTWTKVNLVSAGNAYAAGSEANFNIVSSGGVDCLIDDITFGAETVDASSDPVTTPTSLNATAVTPRIREYAGSTFNGDFEVGSALVGNQYWGQYVPQQSAVAGSPDLMKLVVSPAGTEPGVIKSGKNMVSITRGGVAWNIAALSSDSADQLPRVGDLVGGGYWLYVPAGADPSLGIPAVSFIYKTGGADVTIADTATFPVTSLVKGAWNLVPIHPNGNTIGADATAVGIIVTAPVLDASTNPLYPSTYYLDDIRVGAIPAVVGFAGASRLVDAAGATITTPDSGDSLLRAEAVVQNSAGASASTGYLVLNLYEQARLKTSAIKPLTIAAKGTTGVSYTEASISASLDGLDRSGLGARLFLYADPALKTELAAPFTLMRQTRRIAPTDADIRYFGRWSPEGPAFRGNWVRPYFKIEFTGSTEVKIDLLQSASLSVVLDGVATTYNSVDGLVSLGDNLDAAATHTLRVATLTWQDALLFDAIELDDSGVLRPAEVRNDEIEFIGDSITAWNNGYSWLVPERLGVEGSRICWPGIALVDGFGYYTPPAGYGLSGMTSAYFLNGMPGYGTAGNWDFAASPYSPRIVVINLGTNDGAAITGNPTLVGNFQSAYANLIRQVRVRFPAAEIFVLRGFSIVYSDVQVAILNAAQSVISEGDAHVHYLDTTDWGVAIGFDGIHPTDAGHATITDRLAPILAPYLKGGVEDRAPSITSASSTTFAQGSPGAFTVVVSGEPAPVFDAVGLPAWASLDTRTGMLAGTPAEPGSQTFTVRADNGIGTPATQSFTLRVTASFEQWAEAHFTLTELANPAVSGADAMPFHDGVPNLLKYAAGIDPAVPLSAAGRELLPRVDMQDADGAARLTLTYVLDSRAGDAGGRIESSTDLKTWNVRVPDALRYSDPTGTDDFSVIEADVDMGDAKSLFLRLRVGTL